jgi:hypothetical protein
MHTPTGRMIYATANAVSKRALLLGLLLLAMAGLRLPGFAQAANENGMLPYGAYHGGNLDQVNLSNGHLELRVPIKDYPQRGGKLKLTFIARYNNLVWNQTNSCPPVGKCFYFWQFSPSIVGMQFLAEEAPPQLVQHCLEGCSTSSPVFAYSVLMPDQSEHPLGNTSGTLYETLDATGIKMDIQAGNVTLADGTRYVNITSSNPVMEDTHESDIPWSADRGFAGQKHTRGSLRNRSDHLWKHDSGFLGMYRAAADNWGRSVECSRLQRRDRDVQILLRQCNHFHQSQF